MEPSRASQKTSSVTSRRWLLAALVALALGIALRIGGLWDDFWLDEIWSLRLSKLMQRPADVLLKRELHHDNNHPLNTLFLYWLGDLRDWVPYRLLALVSGIGTLGLAWWSARRRSAREGFVVAAVLAVSYLLVAYSAEARGYAPALFFAFLARACLAREKAGWPQALAFGLCVVLGFLSHFAFAHVYLGFLAWSAWRVLRGPRELGRGLARLALWHALPLAAAVGLQLVFVSKIAIGGAPEIGLPEVLEQAIAWTYGAPARPAVALGLALFSLVVLARDMLALQREGSDEWVFELATIIVAPAATLLLLRPEVVLPRYFLLPIAFLLLAFARELARALARPGLPRTAAILLALAYAAGSTTKLVPFLRVGRGECAEAVAYMAARSPRGAIVVGSDDDFRNRMVLEFYGRRLSEGLSLRYVPQPEIPTIGPQWILRHGKEKPPDLEQSVRILRWTYVLERNFPYAGPTGFQWWLYRRQDG